jgi:hypothetical protein
VRSAASARGDARPACGWRSNLGNEIDVPLEQDDGVARVEAKSGQTFQPKWPKSLATVGPRMQTATRAALVHGGDFSRARAQAQVGAWRDLVGAD